MAGAFFAAFFPAFFAVVFAALGAALAARLTELVASGSSHFTIGGFMPTLSVTTPPAGPGASHLRMGGFAPRLSAKVPLAGPRTGGGARAPTGLADAVFADLAADFRAGLADPFGEEVLAVDLAFTSLAGLAVVLMAAFFAGLAVTVESPLSEVLADGDFGFVALVMGDLRGVTFADFFAAFEEPLRTARVLSARA